MEYIGYFTSILIGVALGLIGGGSCILTLPVLVYLFAIEPVLATTYSLIYCRICKCCESCGLFQKRVGKYQNSIFFGIPSIIAVFTSRAFIVPTIPKEVFSIGEFIVTKTY
ncbi:TSUP family transporter [Flavobacterium sp. LB1P51]|uniref:TSUP family transporter n=1 Tax=Flavobacterium algoritolerans TaxID=3041254 RepID=A0ABT6V9Q2_9FLAO|nr:TSUP family transporter [Flavobacterium algoritolerans]MDI5894932.1 TSUP family transporter [Flavobacterium algoritolerans]